MKLIMMFFVSCFLLTSCATNSPVELNYYLLDSATSPSLNNKQTSKNTSLVVIENIKLSEYLQQSSLSMQTTEHQIRHAHNHLWAEPLSDAIVKVLLKDLRATTADYQFEERATLWQGKERYQIALQINQFHPVTQQQVILSGRFWLTDLAGDKTQAKDFNYTKQLMEDGYAHSVEQQRQLLNELAQHIADSIFQLNK